MWHGPFRITEVFLPNVRIVPVDAPRQKGGVVHVNRLKPCYDSHIPDPTALPVVEETLDSEGEEVPIPASEEKTEMQPHLQQVKQSDQGLQRKAPPVTSAHKYNLRLRQKSITR